MDLIDLRRLKGWADFAQVIRSKNFDVAGITMMSVDYNPATRCVEILKEVKPNVKIIVGGPRTSILPQELTRNKKIDYVFIGEGEISIVELVQKIESGYNGENCLWEKTGFG